MFSIYFCKSLNNNFYDLKYNLSGLQNYVKKYNLKDKYLQKCYYKNNILIEADEKNIFFFKIIDKQISFKDNYLISEYDKINYDKFSFYNVDYEEEYQLYENNIKNVLIKCKKFKDYFEIQFLSDDLNCIKEIIV